jgi:hypothetical protein
MSVSVLVFDLDKLPHSDEVVEYLHEIPCIPNGADEHGKVLSANLSAEVFTIPWNGVFAKYNSPTVDSPILHCIFVRGDDADWDLRDSVASHAPTPGLQDLYRVTVLIEAAVGGTILRGLVGPKTGNVIVEIECNIDGLNKQLEAAFRANVFVIDTPPNN